MSGWTVSSCPPTRSRAQYCEYRQDSRLVGSTYPNMVTYVSTDDRRRSNVSLVSPNLCRLTWAPMADEKPYTYTCRVYEGNSWKENSMAGSSQNHSHLLCSQCYVQISTVVFDAGDLTSCGRGSHESLSWKCHNGDN
ncbi:hypothetical protein FQA47_000475 [Oryzias melastigma]|uniref:Uncharacterized protein n=1 Tax=Oryzias melastigma TaxID=30732 RepID=A0A834FCB2_ORYME|nr:hypothetical protein FQA47_000475 [Oryzias melastigma]